MRMILNCGSIATFHPMRHQSPSKRLRIALGTWVAIEAMATDADEELSAIETAYAVIEAVATRMHPTRPGPSARAAAATSTGS